MWTTLDGQETAYEALGTVRQGATARFGRMPDELIQAFARESRRTEETMLRIELSEAEYRRTHQVFEAWNALLKEQDKVNRPRQGPDHIAFRQEVTDDLSVGPHMRLVVALRIESLDQRPGRRFRREWERQSGSETMILEKQDIIRCQPETGLGQRNRQSGLPRTRTSAKKH